MRRIVLLSAFLSAIYLINAQTKDFTYHFYGFIRGDLFYNNRANVAPVDGNFYLYPKDRILDANGKDINEVANGSFYTFTTRLGLDIKGPNIGSARSSAKIETDFGGFSSSNTMIRIRQAYVALQWKKTSLLIGHTWHPLFGSVCPDILSLATGAPFQPFNRSPQLRLQYQAGNVKLLAATIWQLQYTSNGPNGSSEEYLKNSCVPELYAGADYQNKGFIIGGGAHLISLKPRTSSIWNGKTYKVNERMTTYSLEGHFKYTSPNFMIAGKSLLASCLDHAALVGGYGISSIDEKTGEQEYTPFRHSTSWINVAYGTKWKPSLFVGYTKNLGTDDALASKTTYGSGLNIDKIFIVNACFSYNIAHWQLGLEYCPASAWYGTNDLKDGKVRDTHKVTNQRILALMMYYF